jgi:hypothetical protein
MPRRKSKNPKSCPRGKTLVKVPGRSFCASKTKRKGRRSGKLSGIAKMSTAARKKMTRETCKKKGMKAKMPGLCKWAGA